MGEIQEVVFDLDGVMVDTESASRQAWDIVLRDFDTSLDEETCLRILGRRSDESAEIIKETLSLSIDASVLLKLKTKTLNTILAQGVLVMPGLMALVEKLSHCEVAWAVATASPRKHAESILLQIGLLEDCSALVGGDEVLKSKPDPDIYLLAAERVGAAPQKCLAIEDSVPGCRAAVDAGMVTVAVPNAQIERSDFHFADYICSSLYGVADQLDKLIR